MKFLIILVTIMNTTLVFADSPSAKKIKFRSENAAIDLAQQLKALYPSQFEEKKPVFIGKTSCTVKMRPQPASEKADVECTVPTIDHDGIHFDGFHVTYLYVDNGEWQGLQLQALRYWEQ